jgi:hypothetical protein
MDEIKAGRFVEFCFALDLPVAILLAGKYPIQFEIKNK